MNAEAALRNFRDFLTIYNKISEQCFAHCINDLGQRQLTSDEEACVDRCTNKNIKLNHRMMETYMKIQPEINQKRLQEQEALQQGVMQVGNST